MFSQVFRDTKGENRVMKRKHDAPAVWLRAVALTVGPAFYITHGTDVLAFAPPTVYCRSLPLVSLSSGSHLQQASQLRPLQRGGGRECASLSGSAAWSPSGQQQRWRRRRRPGQVIVAVSSGLQEPLERFEAVAVAAAGDGMPGSRKQGWQARRLRGLRRTGVAGAAAAAAAAGGVDFVSVSSEGSTAGSLYAGVEEGGDEEEVGDASGRAVDYGFDFEDEDEIDIYLPGGPGAGLRPGCKPRRSKPPPMWSKPVKDDKRFRVVLAGREDLDEAGALCIKVFFGEPDTPWKAAQLRQLTREQGQDLESRCNRKESVMFKAIDIRRKGAMVGFVEVSESAGTKYGMGSGVPIADTRPVVSNLAVDPQARRSGIGTALMEACEDLVKTWDMDEIILQVEEDNEAALAFYGGMGFKSLFVDRAARRYDTSGFLLQNVRTSKLTMRKAIDSDEEKPPKDGDNSLGDQLTQLLEFLTKPFAVAPPPYTRLPARSAASLENLFGPPGRGGDSGGAGRKKRSTGDGSR